MIFTQYWRKLTITSKFILAFGVLLALVLIIALTSFFALTAIGRRADAAVATVTQLHQVSPDDEPLDTTNQEIERVRDQIAQTISVATVILIITIIAVVVLAGLIALLLNRNIVRRKDTEEVLQRQNDYLEALHETAIGLISHLDLDELLEDIMTRAGQLLGTEHSYIYLVEPGGTEIQRKVGAGIYGESVGFRMKPGEGVAGRVWQSGHPLAVNDLSVWTGRSPNINYDRICSLAGVPLISRSKVVGVLGMAYDVETGSQFEDDEIKLLSRFAQLASLALDNAQLYTSAQQEKKRSDDLLNVVIPIGVALSAEQNFDRLLENILLEAKSFSKADGGTLYLRTENDNLRFVIVRNDSLRIVMGGTSDKTIEFPPIPLYDEAGEPNHSNVAAHVALTGASINIPDAYQVEGFNFSGTKAFDKNTGYRSTSFLTIPLKNAHNHVVGVLQLINAIDPNTRHIIPFEPALEQIVSSLSSLATVALEAYIREQKLRRQIQQLRIEVDDVKRQQQVTEIVETDFFQDLQNKARRIRSRSNRFQKTD